MLAFLEVGGKKPLNSQTVTVTLTDTSCINTRAFWHFRGGEETIELARPLPLPLTDTSEYKYTCMLAFLEVGEETIEPRQTVTVTLTDTSLYKWPPPPIGTRNSIRNELEKDENEHRNSHWTKSNSDIFYFTSVFSANLMSRQSSRSIFMLKPG
ncbi:hypothetical protein EVAR_77923_1 [Eumeta japonica]|uniref:Uncharacterized protein n=1 Tax=Eumeta variegata TaxID=151549 RepID=A0A4C1XVP8_EUMVA|nr:hypothetical protein EVAR_77923_1 [Eumeta japonica]